MNTKTQNKERVAYTPAEFAGFFGREATWTYRLYYAGKIKVIQGYGARLIPASERDRLLEGAKEISPKHGKFN